jgi:predicted nucleic acid-binding protein
MRVFLDANVLFSAAHRSDSPLRAFFRLAETKVCELLASPFALDEARRNIARKHAAKATELEQLIEQITICREAGVEEVQWARSTGLPEKDAPILAAAAQARADMLVTGDRTDFGSLYGRKLRGLEVLPPRTALERILAAEGGKSGLTGKRSRPRSEEKKPPSR